MIKKSRHIQSASKVFILIAALLIGIGLSACQKDEADSSKEADTGKVTQESVDATQEAADKAAVPNYRALLNFNAAYARWAQSPAMQTLSMTVSAINATMMVVQKSLANYK